MDKNARQIYEELHKIARARLASQRSGHTLQPTALVSEAWLKLCGHFDMSTSSPLFFQTAAHAMRQILIDYARGRRRLKRGGASYRKAVDPAELADKLGVLEESDPAELLELDQALQCLEQKDSQLAEVVKLRFFAGLSVEETARAMGVSERTVKRDWQFARGWLRRKMSESPRETGVCPEGI